MMAELPEAAHKQSPLSNLLTMVAKSHLGEVAGIIVSTLLSHGRLTAGDISIRSGVPMKLVKTTLVSLIQLNCVLFWQEGSKVEYLFSETGLMTFLHSGEIITHIKYLYDEEASEIIQNLIQVGNVKIKDLLKNAEVEEAYAKNVQLMKLFNGGWIKIFQTHDFHPIEDIWGQIFKDTTKYVPRAAALSEVRRVGEITQIARSKITNLLESLPSNLFVNEGTKALNPRLTIGFNYARFQKYLRSKALVNLCESRIGILSSQVYRVILNSIEKNSPDAVPYLTKVDGIFNDPEDIRKFHSEIESKSIESKSIVIKVHEIEKLLPENLVLDNSILGHNFLKPNLKRSGAEVSRPAKKTKLSTEIKQEDSVQLDVQDIGTEIKQELDAEIKQEPEDSHQEDDSNITIESDDEDYHKPNGTSKISIITHHLKLLSSSTTIPFLMELGNGTYTVPYYKLRQMVKEYTYEELIKKTLGLDALRVLRCIRSLQLVDEKTIANSVLAKDRVVRNEIYKLIELNVIEIQEIPRSQDRAASKTFFAFRYKNNFKFVKNSLLFNMANIYHNIEEFKLQHKVLLEKCEREDVKGHEQELLLESELRTLNGLQIREIHNVGKLQRVLSLYDIFS